MKLFVHWTYTNIGVSFTRDKIITHQTRKEKNIGENRYWGLGFSKQLFTRYISRDGRLILLQPEKKEIHLAILGGLNEDFKCCNTLTREQLLSLGNEIKSIQQSFPGIEIQSNLTNFDLQLWLKAIS